MIVMIVMILIRRTTVAERSGSGRWATVAITEPVPSIGNGFDRQRGLGRGGRGSRRLGGGASRSRGIGIDIDVGSGRRSHRRSTCGIFSVAMRAYGVERGRGKAAK